MVKSVTIVSMVRYVTISEMLSMVKYVTIVWMVKSVTIVCEGLYFLCLFWKSKLLLQIEP